MTETKANTNTNIHVLADETLGGIKREYVEVDRKAEVGDRIILRDDDEIGTFLESNSSFVYLDLGGYRNGVACDPACCRVLEPTDIVHIDGRRYEMVEREGEVGDKVIHVYKGESNGIVRVVRKAADDGVDVDTFEDEGELYSGFYHGYYCVLVPLDKEKTFENKHNVYKELKNLIHNELGISRQDIQKMISNAVSNEVQKMSESGKLDRVAGEKI
ncbi:hypothetical protein P5495_021525 [Bacillus velezensis]|uniref:hypothetical protein n=1 Tax=Bacillus velezensis TaxID=492670 RepID=UPI0037EC7F96|nr:hypothetical protein [Bacillus velezensis]MDH3107144.1 hypothetical protein [Bacillus velezensis]MDH3135630.1 hypothetical protein [Bacillus velezensis]